jgi:aspartyl-tRNA(Asn)/glutamyl-tRNA(Gln) amidotransferase subunit A
VSLAEGSALLALGTDTAGSARIPASFTGQVGLKTSKGRWSTDGVVPLSFTLDTVGVLTRTVEDAIFCFAVIDERYGDPRALERALPVRDPAGLRLGVVDGILWDECGPGVAEAVEAALEELERSGARRASVDVPEVEQAIELFRTKNPAAIELYFFLERELPGRLNAMDPNVAARVGDAGKVTAADYLGRIRDIEALGQTADSALREVDVIVSPTVAITPPTVESVSTPDGYRHQNLLTLRNTSVANYLGLCALTLPVGKDRAGMPVGLQLMARHGHEEHLLAVARAVEGALGTGRQRLGSPPAM